MPTPNPTLRREYKGAAAATTLQNSMTNADTTFVLVSNTNWPTGAVGKFIVTINRGQADEEKVLCDTQSARTVACLLANRGFDGTTAQSHAAGATVECTISAFDADEWNQHTNATGAVHGVAGSVVGTTDTQTLSNKTLTAPTVTGVTTETGVHSPDTALHVGLTVKGLSGQSGDLQEWQDFNGNVVGNVKSDGKAVAPYGSVGGDVRYGANSTAMLSVNSTGTGNEPLVLRGSSGQTVSLLEAQAFGGAVLAKIDSAGNITATNLTSAWTAYTPSTFGNCTSPTGTFKYLLIGKTLHLHAQFTGGTATGAGAITFSLPGGVTAATIGISGGIGLTSTITNMAWTASVLTVTSGTAFTAGQSLSNVWANGTIEVA